MRPAAQFLSLTRQRKKPKKGDPTSATPALRAGANLRRASDGVGRRTHFALFERSVQTAAASQFTKRLHAALQPPPRQNRAAGAASRGIELPYGPSRCSALGPRREAHARSGPSAAMARMVSPPLWTCREAQRAGCAWTPKDVHASCSDSLQLFERRCAAAKRVLQRTPLASIAGCPIATRWGHGQWGRLLLPSFLGESRKEGAPPGACPGLSRSFTRQHPTSAQRTCTQRPNAQQDTTNSIAARADSSRARASKSPQVLVTPLHHAPAIPAANVLRIPAPAAAALHPHKKTRHQGGLSIH